MEGVSRAMYLYFVTCDNVTIKNGRCEPTSIQNSIVTDDLIVEVSKGTISINTPKSTKVAIVDMAGKQVWTGAIQGKKSIALPAGTYLVNNKKVLMN